MKISKVLTILIIAVFVLSSAVFCGDLGTAGCNRCCVDCCVTGCHAVALKSDKIRLFSSRRLSSSQVPLNIACHQEPIIRGIDHPPKIIL